MEARESHVHEDAATAGDPKRSILESCQIRGIGSLGWYCRMKKQPCMRIDRVLDNVLSEVIEGCCEEILCTEARCCQRVKE